MSVDLWLSHVGFHRRHLRVVLDVLLLCGLILFSLNFTKVLGPATQRGFFCDDESLMYPYRENTVSSDMLHWMGLYLPMLALLLIDGYGSWRAGRERITKLWHLYNTMRWFLFGHAAEQLIKDMGKRVIGRLRPHFFMVCQPLLGDGGSCTDELQRGLAVYHTNYTCQPAVSGATTEMLTDLHVSFPSGHSSMAFYGLLYLALHLQRIRWPHSGTLLRPLCQLLCIMVASFVGLSRVMDYKHHWSDVAAGSLLGATIAIAAVHGAEVEQRLHRCGHGQSKDANVKEPQTAAAAVAVAKTDEDVATAATHPAPPKEIETQQLPHELCEVACHSCN